MTTHVLLVLLLGAPSFAEHISQEVAWPTQFCHAATECGACVNMKHPFNHAKSGNCGWCKKTGKCGDVKDIDSTCPFDCVGSWSFFAQCLHHTCPAPVPTPAPTAPVPLGGPTAGQLYCGFVGGSWDAYTNLTILPDGKSMKYMWQSAKAPFVVSCPNEPFRWTPGVGCDAKSKPGCGTLDVSSETSNPSDCFAKALTSEGGGQHTFLFNGDGTIASEDSRVGTISLRQTFWSSCDGKALLV